ncbi:MAG TPA: ECF RNA polymerase sigma factor SigK [Jiangellaceae bacterium]|nr:ECF RNA polymerase sigma factor SigK [Jiangellaceae bacterium]
MTGKVGRLGPVKGSGRPVGLHKRSTGGGAAGGRLEELLGRAARGDQAAFGALYDATASQVFGTVLRVVRDRSQSEEVTQEVFIDVWRHAARFDPAIGSVRTWILTMAHRRAVDRVRRSEAASGREHRAASRSTTRDYDEVVETVERSLEAERVRRCLEVLTDLQRESVTLAYYSGYTYPEVAQLLDAPLGTVKTRMRDGLVRMRDCLGVSR